MAHSTQRERSEIIDEMAVEGSSGTPSAKLEFEEQPQSRDTRPVPPLPPPAYPRFSSVVERDRFSDNVPLRVSEVIAGRYRVERILRRSGPGVIAQVRHLELGQRLILKCLSGEACSPDTASRFLRGARAAIQLSSPHTVRTIDAGRLPSGSPYVVREMLRGSSLREALRFRGVLSADEAVEFVLQICESLAEAHAQGLVHGNLNLDTLFWSQQPDGSPLIKVTDFGVAELLRGDSLRVDDAEADEGSLGSGGALEAWSCSSPEQIRGARDLDPRCDIWSLGAILHQLISGYPAFQAETPQALLIMIAADPAPVLTSYRSDLPFGLETAVLRCLEKDRTARFSTVSDLALALKPFVSKDAQGSVERVVRTLSRNDRASKPNPAALVYVGPPPVAQAAAVVAAAPTLPPRFQTIALLWSTALVAFGLVGGTLAGVLLSKRGLEGRVTSSAPIAAPPAAPSSASTPNDSPRPPSVVSRALPATEALAVNATGSARQPNRALPRAPARPVTSPLPTETTESLPRQPATDNLFDTVR